MSLLNYATEEFQHGFEEVMTAPQNSTQPQQETSCFTCPICLLIARYPIEVKCCRHWYCCVCFLRYFKDPSSQPTIRCRSAFRCAICRAIISARFDTTSKPLIHRLITYHNIIVMCPFYCGKTGDPLEIIIHERNSCPKRPLRCPFPDCDVIMPAAEIINHISLCPNYTIFCPKCGINIKIDDILDHNCIRALKKVILDNIPDGKIYCVLGAAGRPVAGLQAVENAKDKENPLKIYEENFGDHRKTNSTIQRQEIQRAGPFRLLRSDVSIQWGSGSSTHARSSTSVFALNDNPRLWTISSTLGEPENGDEENGDEMVCKIFMNFLTWGKKASQNVSKF